MKNESVVTVMRYWALVGESSIDGRLSGSEHWTKLEIAACFAGDIARLIVMFDRWTNSLIYQRPRARGYDSVRFVVDGKVIVEFGESTKPGNHYEEMWNRSVSVRVKAVPEAINPRQMLIDEPVDPALDPEAPSSGKRGPKHHKSGCKCFACKIGS